MGLAWWRSAGCSKLSSTTCAANVCCIMHILEPCSFLILPRLASFPLIPSPPVRRLLPLDAAGVPGQCSAALWHAWHRCALPCPVLCSAQGGREGRWPSQCGWKSQKQGVGRVSNMPGQPLLVAVEWLPGVQLGNTGFSWSDILLGALRCAGNAVLVRMATVQPCQSGVVVARLPLPHHWAYLPHPMPTCCNLAFMIQATCPTCTSMPATTLASPLSPSAAAMVRGTATCLGCRTLRGRVASLPVCSGLVWVYAVWRYAPDPPADTLPCLSVQAPLCRTMCRPTAAPDCTSSWRSSRH